MKAIKRFIATMLALSTVTALPACNMADIPDAVRNLDLVLMKDVYEAEEATLENATTSTDFDDYSGTACVSGINNGSKLTFTLDIPVAAEYALDIRYVNGSEVTKNLEASLNGAFLQKAAFEKTPNETTWCEKMVCAYLKEGENTLTLSCRADNDAGISVDRIDVARVYQAENGTLVGGIKSMNTFDGFTGNGYVPFNQMSNAISFEVDAPVKASYEMVFRYSANQTDSNGRSISLKINENAAEQMFLNPTRSDTVWGVYRHTVSLNEGKNNIELSFGANDSGMLNLDCITLKPTNWTYAGKIDGFTGNGTSRLEFKLDNCVLRIDSVDEHSLKIWLDEQGLFERKYDSVAVVNENVNPQKLKVKEKSDYYYFNTGDLTVRIYKDPLRIVYLDGNEIVAMNDAYSMGWSSDGELICRNVLGEDEHFWGLGETPLDFDRLGTKVALWGNDIVAARSDSAVIAETDDGRWYMNNPVFTSSKGYTILFDNPSRTVFDFGVDDKQTYYFASLNPYPAGEMIYYFIYGPSVKDEMTGLSNIIGKSFFAPLWGYGNMQSHWGYTQEDMERVATEYREKGIPLELIIADIEWYQFLCTPTEWNETNFPDPEGMIEYLEQLDLLWGVIDDPNITAKAPDYLIGDQNGYFVKGQDGETLNVNWPWGDQSGLVDFFNPEAQKWWQSLHAALIEQGISFFWMDMNEPARYNSNWYFYNDAQKAMGTLADCKNIYAQMQQRTMYDLMTQNGKRTIMLTRSGYTGTQRYACPWTGDIYSDWIAMQQQLSLGLGLSMSGYHYWTCDIGGSSGGLSDNQFKRWIELGTFLPITRYHSTAQNEQREPYTHDAEEIADKYITLRYRLLPYFYSLSADSIIGIGYESDNGGSGLPLVRPMVMEYDDDPETYGLDTQFMSGQSFLVAPVVIEATKRNIYLPEGMWYDYNDNMTLYEGGQKISYKAPIDVLPVLVKAGSIIPMQDGEEYTSEKELTTLYLDVYPTKDSGEYYFVYYEDDGETDDYLDGVYATTRLEGKTKKSLFSSKTEFSLDIGARQGKYTDITDRDYIVQMHITDSSFVSAEIDGKEVAQVASYEQLTSAAEGVFVEDGIAYVKTHDTAQAKNITVTVE